MTSDDVLGGQHAGLVGVRELNLDRRMGDAEAAMKLITADAAEHCIAR